MLLRSRHSRRGLGGLVLLNAALLAGLALVTFSPFATAQGFRAKGTYHAVSGNVPGKQAGCLYIVDEVNQQMIVLGFDPSTRTVHVVSGRDLAADAAQFGRSRN